MEFVTTRVRALLATAAVASAICFSVKTASADSGDRSSWPVMGRDLANSRNQPEEHDIGIANVQSLAVKWTFTTGGDVSATPTVSEEGIYFPDWAGNLYAVHKENGRMIWSRQISEYDGVQGAVARVSPAIHGDDIIVGDIQSTNQPHAGANIMAVNRHNGKLHWITKVDDHLAAMITGSQVLYGDVVYTGVSSNEESLATNPAYPCCSFRGSVVALDANTGQILWKMFVAPEGYSGNAVWQPAAIDPARGVLYIGTGNNYEVPDSVKACIAAAAPSAQPACFAPNDYFDAALALDLKTGQVRWSRRLQGVDVWTVACVRNPNPVSCPLPSSPDYDLGGSGPNLMGSLVGFGQKSGIYWALNANTGDIVWSTVVGPGGTLGGIEWGTAADAQRIYVAITNNAHKPYPLIDGTTVTSGAWSALDRSTGKILWQTADPVGALDMGSVSVANGVVYAPSISGNMHGLDAATGKVLWTFASGGAVLDGPSIADGVLYWGSGYKKTGGGAPNNKVYAFAPAVSDSGNQGRRH